MATTVQVPFASSDPSTTSLLARTVQDRIRNIIPANSPLLTFVANGVAKDGKMVTSPGMISKQVTNNVRFEMFTHTPPGITKTAGAVSSLVVTFASVADIYVRQMWTNTANGTVGVVDLISSLDVTFVSVGAGDTFSVTEGDTLMRLAPAYEENSSDPAYLQVADDNTYGTTQIMRWPVAISRTGDAISYLGGGNFFARQSLYAMQEGKRDADRCLIFGKRASSGNKTSFTNIGVSASTTQGIYHYSQTDYDGGGNFTPDKMFKAVPQAMDSSVSDNDRIIMLTSKKVRGNMISWGQDSIRYDGSKKLEKFGIKAHKFVTAGPDIEVISHDAFNRGGYENQALCFIPDRLTYRFLKGGDFKPNNNIQSPSTDGKINEILAEIGIGPDDGGVSIMKMANLY